MGSTRELEERLKELELRYSEQHDTVQQLSDVVFELQKRVDVLVKELLQLKQRSPDQAEPQRSLEDDKPPHY